MSDRSPLPPCPFAVGDVSESSLAFTVGSIRAFATLVGDPNPLHHDEAFAATSRFGGIIASAADFTARMIGAVAAFLGGRGLALGLEFAFTFKRAVGAGETLDLRWTVVAVEPKPSLGGHIVTLHGALCRSDGSPSITATSKAVVMPDGKTMR